MVIEKAKLRIIQNSMESIEVLRSCKNLQESLRIIKNYNKSAVATSGRSDNLY